MVANRVDAAQTAMSDRILRGIQTVMFSYDVSVWKSEDRLKEALVKIKSLQGEAAELSAPHVHELVRLQETEAMLLAAELILTASLARTESRLSHFREDYDFRDDINWLKWIDMKRGVHGIELEETPIPTPILAVEAVGTPTTVSRLVRA